LLESGGVGRQVATKQLGSRRLLLQLQPGIYRAYAPHARSNCNADNQHFDGCADTKDNTSYAFHTPLPQHKSIMLQWLVLAPAALLEYRILLNTFNAAEHVETRSHTNQEPLQS
jgi:hypothetical protein